MITIPKEELLASLKMGYEEVRALLSKGAHLATQQFFLFLLKTAFFLLNNCFFRLKLSDLEAIICSDLSCTVGSKGADEADIAHVKGFCTTIEQILAAYGSVSKEEMLQIKRPILGEISLRRRKSFNVDSEDEQDMPTIFRKNNNKQ